MMFESGKRADVTIKTDSGEIKAHSFILAQSEVFDVMLNEDDTEEAQTKIIVISDVEQDVLNEMLRFMYCDETPKMNEMAHKLMKAADKYGIKDLVDICKLYLTKNVNMENFLKTLVLADQHNIQELKDAVIKFVRIHRKEILQSEDWKQLENDDIHLAAEVMKKCLCAL